MGPFLSTQPNPIHQIHTQPNPNQTNFMLLADPTQLIKLVLLWPKYTIHSFSYRQVWDIKSATVMHGRLVTNEHE